MMSLEPSPPAPASPESAPRHLRCVSVLHEVVAAGPTPEVLHAPGAVRPTPWRRCPPGVIQGTDCPEVYGVACAHHRERGTLPQELASEAEQARLRAEVGASGYPAGRYALRVRALWGLPPAPPRVLPSVPEPDAAALRQADARLVLALDAHRRAREAAAAAPNVSRADPA